MPDPAASASVVSGVCIAPLPRTSEPPKDSADNIGLDGSPSGALVYWLPGLNDQPCVMLKQRWLAAEAGTLVKRVRSSGVSHQQGSCPRDDGAAVRAYLLYDGKAPEVVDVTLGGCQGVTAPGRHARNSLKQLRALLADHAPGKWKHYFP